MLKMAKQKPCRSTLLLFLFFLISRLPLVQSHGLLTDPRQRGAFRVQNRLVETINSSAPFDSFAHFPAGDKSIAKGSGKRSVIRHANNNWIPYEPLNPSFHFRAGVCGDEPGREQEHLKGGQYYYPEDDPIRARTYTQGEVVSFESNIVTHHNGFLEFFICNIDECGRDISEECFREGHCQQLLRAPSYCDNGQSEDCGPIDPAYPGRWYLPCGPFPNGQILYGGSKGSMQYQLPEDLVCDHCVIQWYWTGANTCNPPGVIEYFDGEHGPKWPDCIGQGGAIGGVTRVQRPCEGERFSEEYWQCADVRILPKDGNEGPENDDNGSDEQEDPPNSSGGFIPTGENGSFTPPKAPDGSSILRGNVNMPQPSSQSPLQKTSGAVPSVPLESGNDGILPMNGGVTGVGAFGQGLRPAGMGSGTEERAEATTDGEVAGDADTSNNSDGGRNEESGNESGENGLIGGIANDFPGKKRGRGLAGLSEGISG